jgi:hypothetical protein
MLLNLTVIGKVVARRGILLPRVPSIAGPKGRHAIATVDQTLVRPNERRRCGTKAMINDIAWHMCRSFGPQRLIVTRDHALTGAALASRPFGPKPGSSLRQSKFSSHQLLLVSLSPMPRLSFHKRYRTRFRSSSSSTSMFCRRSITSAFKFQSARSPACNFTVPAAAIIAALSVERWGEGK